MSIDVTLEKELRCALNTLFIFTNTEETGLNRFSESSVGDGSCAGWMKRSGQVRSSQHAQHPWETDTLHHSKSNMYPTLSQMRLLPLRLTRVLRWFVLLIFMHIVFQDS